MECKNNVYTPYILNDYYDIYFIYKPPNWNCITNFAYTKIKKLQQQNPQAREQMPKNYQNLILDWIKDNLKVDDDIHNDEFRYGLVNRIDLDTSGILMVAKTKEAFYKYRQQINDHIKTTKIYITLVSGSIKERFGIIRIPLLKIQRAKDSITVPNEKRGSPTYTEFVKLREYKHDGKIYTLLLIKIKTGITHQIRVHMTTKNTYVVCDNKYEPKKTLSQSCKLTPRLFLHSYFYEVEPGVNGTACLAADLKAALNKMKLVKQYKTFKKALALLKDTKMSAKNISKTTEARTLNTTLLGHKKTKKSRLSLTETEAIENDY